jgi:hypothetical protein
VIDDFFATSFSKLLGSKISAKFLRIHCSFDRSFCCCKRLFRVGIDDQLTLFLMLSKIEKRSPIAEPTIRILRKIIDRQSVKTVRRMLSQAIINLSTSLTTNLKTDC